MNPERLEQIEQLYNASLEREPKDRGRFLAGACEGDPELRREVEYLLAHAKTFETFLEKPALEGANPSLVDDHAPHKNKDSRLAPRPPWWMYLLAVCFLARAVFLTAFCFFGPEPMGIEVRATEKQVVVRKVAPDSPAERAGVRVGDMLVRANERPILDVNYWDYFLGNVEIAQPIVLETERQGERRRAVLVLKRRPPRYWSTGAGMVLLLNILGQFTGLAVACFLAFLRPKHPLACIGALFLAIYSSAVFIPWDGFNFLWRHSPSWYQVLLWGVGILNSLGLGVFFTFFALFPRPSFRNKWIWVPVWAPILLLSLVFNYQVWHYIYSPENMIPSAWMSMMLASFWLTYLPGSFILLGVKYRRLDETEKRRVRLIVVALAILVVLAVPVVVYSQPYYSKSFGASLFLSLPAGALATLAGVAFPLCFAYTILRHRFFDIRVIIRQSIRYAAAKRFLLLAVPAIIGVFLADLYAHRDSRIDTIVQDRGWIYLGLAGLAVLAHVRRQHWLRSLDRHFFRERYNAQEILRATLERVRTASSLAEVAPIVVKQIEAAMHPLFCAIVEHDRRKRIYELVSIYPELASPPALRPDNKAVELARVMAKPVQLTSDDSWLTRQLPSSETQTLERSGVDLIAPVKGPEDALIVLGRKRSEEPYTVDDMRLLEDVSIGLALLPSRRSPEERFKLEARIGQGGMGSVYEAMDLQLERTVAIKLISENLISDWAARDRFQREARILAGFQHPNVVTLFDVGVMADGRPFLVMERLQGRTLRDELDCRTKLHSDEVRSIVRQLCAGLSAAHRRSLIHRDLKPENIFLCEDVAHRLVKILDFGLAKLLREASTFVQTGTFSTLTGQVAGTPAYMPPELLSGAKPDWNCDIWALAVVTHEMLTGQRPFFSRDSGLAERSLEGLPGCWHDFFNWSLDHEPSQRPGSVDAFLERFEHCAATVYANLQ